MEPKLHLKTIALAAASLLATVQMALSDPKLIKAGDLSLLAEPIAEGLDHPWGLDFLPGGDALVTERPGRMRIVSNGKLSAPVSGVPDVAARGQGGLLDIAVSPDFANTSRVCFSFSEPGNGGAGTAVGCAKLVRDDQQPRLEDLQVVFSMAKKTTTTHHFGSRLVFGPDGSLFITTGDRGESARAQDMQDHAGAVLRIDPDGSIPKDNPSPDGRTSLPEIWSKGHRNVQGAAFDPVTGTLLTVEHGAKGGDELNAPKAGKNYGWPVISYGENYSGTPIGIGTEAPGYEQPLFYWDPSIAPSGLCVYEGPMFPEWQGDLLVGSLKFELVSRLARDAAGAVTGEERILEGEFGRIRDVNVAPDGSVWLLTDESDGRIIRLSRAD